VSHTGRVAAFLSLRRGRSGDVKPLVDAGIDGCGSLVLALGDVKLRSIGTLGGVGDGGVDEAEVLLGGLAGGKLLPGLGALTDNVHGVLLVLALAREGKLVLRLAVWDLSVE